MVTTRAANGISKPKILSSQQFDAPAIFKITKRKPRRPAKVNNPQSGINAPVVLKSTKRKPGRPAQGSITKPQPENAANKSRGREKDREFNALKTAQPRPLGEGPPSNSANPKQDVPNTQMDVHGAGESQTANGRSKEYNAFENGRKSSRRTGRDGKGTKSLTSQTERHPEQSEDPTKIHSSNEGEDSSNGNGPPDVQSRRSYVDLPNPEQSKVRKRNPKRRNAKTKSFESGKVLAEPVDQTDIGGPQKGQMGRKKKVTGKSGRTDKKDTTGGRHSGSGGSPSQPETVERAISGEDKAGRIDNREEKKKKKNDVPKPANLHLQPSVTQSDSIYFHGMEGFNDDEYHEPSPINEKDSYIHPSPKGARTEKGVQSRILPGYTARLTSPKTRGTVPDPPTKAERRVLRRTRARKDDGPPISAPTRDEGERLQPAYTERTGTQAFEVSDARDEVDVRTSPTDSRANIKSNDATPQYNLVSSAAEMRAKARQHRRNGRHVAQEIRYRVKKLDPGQGYHIQDIRAKANDHEERAQELERQRNRKHRASLESPESTQALDSRQKRRVSSVISPTSSFASFTRRDKARRIGDAYSETQGLSDDSDSEHGVPKWSESNPLNEYGYQNPAVSSTSPTAAYTRFLQHSCMQQ